MRWSYFLKRWNRLVYIVNNEWGIHCFIGKFEEVRKIEDIDIFQAILNKNYDVCYEIGKGCGERWANGELVNYNSGYNSGNVILYNHDRQVIYHIPYKGIKWLLPRKSKSK